MITILQSRTSYRLEVAASNLPAMTVTEIADLHPMNRDSGGMWIPERQKLGRALAFAIKSVQRQLLREGSVPLGYGIVVYVGDPFTYPELAEANKEQSK